MFHAWEKYIGRTKEEQDPIDFVQSTGCITLTLVEETSLGSVGRGNWRASEYKQQDRAEGWTSGEQKIENGICLINLPPSGKLRGQRGVSRCDEVTMEHGVFSWRVQFCLAARNLRQLCKI